MSVINLFTQSRPFIRINESLPKDAPIEKWIDDFQKSDAPQFKGKSQEKRREMAIAAFYQIQGK